MADDAGGKLWVMNSQSISLMAFAHATNSSDPPAQTISGSSTLLVGDEADGYQGIAADTTGKMWVPCWYDYNGPYGYVVAFNNKANGNVAPVATTIGYGDKGVAEKIAGPVGVTFDREGDMYVAEFTIPGAVVVFKPPFKDTSRPVAVWTLPNGDLSQYLSVDENDNVYVGAQESIDVYRDGLNSKGVTWYHIGPPPDNFFYDTKADDKGRVFAAMADGISGQEPNVIGVLPRHARSFSIKFVGSQAP